MHEAFHMHLLMPTIASPAVGPHAHIIDAPGGSMEVCKVLKYRYTRFCRRLSLTPTHPLFGHTHTSLMSPTPGGSIDV